MADPCGPDRVERIHGRDQAEPGIGVHHAEPGDGDLALGKHGDQDVERLFRDPVELLQVQQCAGPHCPQQRAVSEGGGYVPAGEHLGRIVLSYQTCWREFRVAFREHHGLARMTGYIPQQRGLAGARRPLDHHVPAGFQCDRQDLAFPAEPDNGRPAAQRARWPGGLRRCHAGSRRECSCRRAGPGIPG